MKLGWVGLNLLYFINQNKCIKLCSISGHWVLLKGRYVQTIYLRLGNPGGRKWHLMKIVWILSLFSFFFCLLSAISDKPIALSYLFLNCVSIVIILNTAYHMSNLILIHPLFQYSGGPWVWHIVPFHGRRNCDSVSAKLFYEKSNEGTCHL